MVGSLASVVVPAVFLAGPAAGVPLRSADVVTVRVTRNSLGDGIESFRVLLTVRNGWHLEPPASGASGTVECRLDGNKAWVHPEVAGIDRVAVRGPGGREYWAYGEGADFVVCLAWDDTQNAGTLAVRVRVVATNGKDRLMESVVVGERRLNE